jgi:hypothetical protein
MWEVRLLNELDFLFLCIVKYLKGYHFDQIFELEN